MVKLITTSVLRDSEQGDSEHGDSHGGVYVIDVERQGVSQVMDFETTDASQQGHDRDRGLRGIAIDGETVYFVASDVLFAFTPNFELIGSWRNPYMKYADEICIYERSLYITSTGYDSILAFELDEKKFFWALHVDMDREGFKGSVYDPTGDKGPLLLNKLHLNNVHADDNGMYITGLKSGGMLHFNGKVINMSVTLAEGTHNAQPFRDGVLFNDSEANALRYSSRSGEEDRALEVEGFARGLCPINDRVVAAGSSPATIALHDLQESKTLLSVSLSRDTRNVIHGLAVWPF